MKQIKFISGNFYGYSIIVDDTGRPIGIISSKSGKDRELKATPQGKYKLSNFRKETQSVTLQFLYKYAKDNNHLTSTSLISKSKKEESMPKTSDVTIESLKGNKLMFVDTVEGASFTVDKGWALTSVLAEMHEACMTPENMFVIDCQTKKVYTAEVIVNLKEINQ